MCRHASMPVSMRVYRSVCCQHYSFRTACLSAFSAGVILPVGICPSVYVCRYAGCHLSACLPALLLALPMLCAGNARFSEGVGWPPNDWLGGVGRLSAARASEKGFPPSRPALFYVFVGCIVDVVLRFARIIKSVVSG